MCIYIIAFSFMFISIVPYTRRIIKSTSRCVPSYCKSKCGRYKFLAKVIIHVFVVKLYKIKLNSENFYTIFNFILVGLIYLIDNIIYDKTI